MGREEFAIHVSPERIELFGMQVSETVITSFAVTLALIILAVVLRIFIIPKFNPFRIGN